MTSAEVKSSTGESIGTIIELIVNPNSGKVDFAVISLSGSAGSTSSSTPSSTTSGTSSATPGTGQSSGNYASNGGKQVVVPFSLLRPANAGGSSTYSSSQTSSSMGQLTFTFTGDVAKLQTAPAFDPNTDITKPGWLQSVFSYFGVNPNYGTGGATSPGGTSSGQSYPQGNPQQ
jgi:hypothetical protein